MNRTSALILTIVAIALCAPQVEAHGARRDHHHKHHARHHSHGWYPGPAYWWGAAYYSAPRAYAYAPYPPYGAATVVVQPDPVVYVERAPAAPTRANDPGALWFYCTDPAGYYPYVERCRQRWVSVDPASVTTPPGR